MLTQIRKFIKWWNSCKVEWCTRCSPLHVYFFLISGAVLALLYLFTGNNELLVGSVAAGLVALFCGAFLAVYKLVYCAIQSYLQKRKRDNQKTEQ
jgi:hypothetical protein